MHTGRKRKGRGANWRRSAEGSAAAGSGERRQKRRSLVTVFFISERLFRYGPNKHKEMKNSSARALRWALLAGDGYRCFDFGKKKKKINAWASVQRGQVEAIALTSPQVSILTVLLLRYWIQLTVHRTALCWNCWRDSEKNGEQRCAAAAISSLSTLILLLYFPLALVLLWQWLWSRYLLLPVACRTSPGRRY